MDGAVKAASYSVWFWGTKLSVTRAGPSGVFLVNNSHSLFLNGSHSGGAFLLGGGVPIMSMCVHECSGWRFRASTLCSSVVGRKSTSGKPTDRRAPTHPWLW